MMSNTTPMDKKSLYREESYTDQKTGLIRKFIPINIDGSDDDTREIKYIGNTQMMTQSGPIPLNFALPSTSLTKAVEAFADCAQKSMEETIKELEKMKRESASSIIVPGDNPATEKKIQV